MFSILLLLASLLRCVENKKEKKNSPLSQRMVQMKATIHNQQSYDKLKAA
jgi:hypothetical protein